MAFVVKRLLSTSSKTPQICILDWLFASEKQGPSSIKLIDTVPAFKSELAKFSEGAVWQWGDISFHLFRKEEVPKYRELIAECFAHHSTFKKYIDFSYEEYIDHELPEYEEQSDFLKFSVAAKVNGELAGVQYSSSWGSRIHDPIYTKPNSESVWKKFENFDKLLYGSIPFNFSSPDEKGRQPFGTLNPNSLLYWSNTGVLPKFKGKNLSYDLKYLCASLGYLHGLKYAMSISFDVRSSFIDKIGGVSFKPTYYKSFAVDGVLQYPDAVEGEGVSCCFLSLS